MSGIIPVCCIQFAKASRLFQHGTTLLNSLHRHSLKTAQKISAPSPAACSAVSRLLSAEVSSEGNEVKSYEPASPYRNPGPRRFGYEVKLHKGGLLPRLASEKSTKLRRFAPKDPWSEEKALFGQNDYIDILGDGDVRPVDLIQGPRWLIGFKGNEMQRVIRQLHFDGPRLRTLYPSQFRNLNKRLKYLYKRFNYKRSHYHH